MLPGLKRKALLLSLVEAMEKQGSWCGETHIQKCSYFLQALLGVPLGFEFILYKHGPFSFDLRDELTAMRADGFLDVRIKETSYGPSLSFTLGPNHEVLSRCGQEETARYGRQILFVARHLAPKGVAELERLGTALFVTCTEGAHDAGERARRIHELKPHVSLEEARAAVETVDALRAEAAKAGVK